MRYCTEKKPNWLEWITPERFNDKDLFRIVIFYVFHSPCNGLSAMKKTLQEYGWNTPWRRPYKLNLQLKDASSNPNLIYSAQSYENMTEALEKSNLADNFPSDFSTERICIHNSQNNQFLSVFYHIRNSLAHGRLNMVNYNKECIFVLEDGSIERKSGQFKVSARMILRKRTLLNWIEIIENGEKEIVLKK